MNKSIGKNAIYNIIYRVLNVIFPLISMAYISRVLSSDGVGRVSAVNNNTSYFLILASLGIPSYGLREIAKRKDEKIERSRLFSELASINLITTLIAYGVFNVFVLNFEYFQKESILYFIFGLTIFLNIFNVDWLFQGMEEYGYIAGRSIIVKVISIIALFVFVKEKSDIYIYAFVQVVALTGNYILNIINSRKYINFSIKHINVRRHLKPLLYLALCTVSTELYAKIDITMLDMIKSSDVVGYYSNSHKIINIIVTTLVAATAVFLPRLSYLFEHDKEDFNKILKLGFSLMVTISIPTCIGVAIVSKPLVLSFLGDDFKNAVLTISILSLMIPLKCIGDLVCYQVMMCARKESLLMKTYLVTMIINFANNLILIPRFGAEGAAVASVISEVLAFGFVFRFSRKYFKLSEIKGTIAKTILCSLIMACVIIPLSYLNISCYVKLILEVGVGVVVFFISCLLTNHNVVIHYFKALKEKLKR